MSEDRQYTCDCGRKTANIKGCCGEIRECVAEIARLKEIVGGFYRQFSTSSGGVLKFPDRERDAEIHVATYLLNRKDDRPEAKS